MDLVNAMQSQYTIAKRLHRVVWVCLAVLVLLGILNLFPAMQPYAGAVAVTVFLLQIAIFALRALAGTYTGEAERVRRMAMLYEGLGVAPSPAQLAQLHVHVATLPNGEPGYIGSYYDSEQPMGPRRLIDITAECAFFTWNNARYFAWFVGGFLIVAIVVTVIGLLAAVFAAPSVDVVQTAGRVFIVAMTFVVAGEFAGTYLAFSGLANACERTCLAAERTLGEEVEPDRDAVVAISLFADYNSAVVKAPPIPGWVYSRRKNLLNDAWKNRDAQPSNGRRATTCGP